MKNKMRKTRNVGMCFTLATLMITTADGQTFALKGVKNTNFHARGGVLVETSYIKRKPMLGVSLTMMSDIFSVYLHSTNIFLAGITFTPGGMTTKYLPQVGAGVMYSETEEGLLGCNIAVSYTLGQLISNRKTNLINMMVSVQYPVYKYYMAENSETIEYNGSANITLSVGPVMADGIFNWVKNETEMPKFSVGVGIDFVYLGQILLEK